MKTLSLLTTLALLGTGALAQADIQLNAGGVYSQGDDDGALGFELGAGFFFRHSTSPLSSSLTLNYLGLGTIEETDPWVDMESGYDVFALDYRLYFPLGAEDMLNLYLEGMAGGASAKVELDASDLQLNADDWGFSWGLGGGLQWNITGNFGLNVGYTFLGLDQPEADGIAIGEDSLHLLRLNALFRF